MKDLVKEGSSSARPSHDETVRRFWEIDFARGIGIVMMIVSNFVTDLQYFENYNSHAIFWHVFAVITATIFIFLVGVSLTVSYSRSNALSKFLKRGAYIFGLGMILTLVTWIFIPQDYIRFGILHLIGISIILAYPFLKLKNNYLILLTAFISVLLGYFIKTMTASSNLLLWTGLTTNGFSSVDYFPLFPWFGLILVGLVAGRLFYPSGIRHFKIPEIKFSKPICWMGRHSLAIYFIHQPILLFLLYLFA